ncbi:hypothetical protein ICN48_07005 [Polynucleobacter sp. JS-Safj-400b-B2]|uniref:TrbI/VirB10 family protein n=1 Tax=Polynucleobacter sp. JS-Safj-400b-B2 TaxID=2576921 RepID=UPI001C0D64AF|nr:TrbI/VirB10 family protein [Polynucleobacter sp. JS-Safj-400b-B2]MBU3625982.1 hypothetical protein [Polynucleobacter sp. JS-Safj-400b-B2]
MSKENPFEVKEDAHQSIDEHAKGKPKKNWKLIMTVIGLIGLVIGVYFLPSGVKKEIKQAPQEAVNPQQTREMLTKQIAGDAGERESAKASKNISSADMPIMPGGVIENGSLTVKKFEPGSAESKQNPYAEKPSGNAPINNYVPQNQSNNRLSPKEEQEKRREDIWASAIDAKGVKLKKAGEPAAVNPYDAITSAYGAGVGGNSTTQMLAAQAQGKAAIATLSDPVKQASQIADLTRSQNTPAQAPTKGAQDTAWLSNQGSNAQASAPLVEQTAPMGAVIQQGTIIRGVLLSGMNTDLPGSITARVVNDVYDSIYQNTLLIPKGSKLIGIYNHDIVVGQERVLVAFSRLIRPDGSSIQLAGAAGTDMQGVSGFPGEVNNHFFKMFGSAAIIGAASALSGGQSVTVTQGLSGTQTGGTVMAQALSDSVNILMQRNKNIAPTITKNSAEEFMFITTRDMRLSPAQSL